MQDRMPIKNLLILIGCLLVCGCLTKPKHCKQFNNEQYTPISIDSMLLQQQHQFIDYLHQKFATQQIDTQLKEAYQIMFYSVHGFDKFINVEDSFNTYKLTMKSVNKKGWSKYKESYEIQIEKQEWDSLKNLIYKYDFWTEETQQKRNDSVLDGFGVVVLGYRAAAKICDKRYKHFTCRASPSQDDKIDKLVQKIMKYEELLHEKYKPSK
jgi:hypothetical protein